MPRWSPGLLLFLAILLCVTALATASWTALVQPWLGTTLTTDGETVTIARVDPAGPAAALPTPARLIAVGPGDGGPAIAIEPGDLVEEPDAIADYAAVGQFLARQTDLAALLAAGPVVLTYATDDGTVATLPLEPQARPPADLPAAFWIQILVGAGGVLIGCWVWALRPSDWGTRMFALSGVAMLVFTLPAAIYSTRELALDGSLFRVLSAINISGASLYGMAMIALFLCYPHRIVRPWQLLAIPAVFVPWTAADVMRLTPGPASAHLATLVQMIGIVAAIGLQWWVTRRDPRARAALRWLGMSVILGAGAFVVTMAVPHLVGGVPALPQGYAFVFFLLIYIGLALGLRRYRLFELGEWSFRVMFYAVGLMVLLALDALLILGLHMEAAPSLGLSLLAVGFAYLPLRDVLWRRMVARRRMPDHELFRGVVGVAFAASAGARAERWQALIRELFDPLELVPAGPDTAAPTHPAVLEDGIALLLPATADAPSLIVRYPWRGRGLFGPVHLKLAGQLSALMRHAEHGRTAYERGATEERRRIARDLHDDIGARLLTGLHQDDLPQTRQTLRDAIAEVRSIVGGLAGDRVPLGRMIAELRHETAQRLEAASIGLDWPVGAPSDLPDPEPQLEYQIYKNMRSALREIVSNAIRHSGATRLTVRIAAQDGRLTAKIGDDGAGMKATRAAEAAGPGEAPRRTGRGLANITRRVEGLGGRLTFPESARGTWVSLTLPLQPPAQTGETAVPEIAVPEIAAPEIATPEVATPGARAPETATPAQTAPVAPDAPDSDAAPPARTGPAAGPSAAPA